MSESSARILALKAYFQGIARTRSGIAIGRELKVLPYERYAPVKNQSGQPDPELRGRLRSVIGAAQKSTLLAEHHRILG